MSLANQPDLHEILNGLRVLVVEDEDDTRHLLAAVLESHGATAFLAGGVTEALEKLNASLPDVVVADIGMPGYNGYAFIAAIRRDDRPEIRDLPVVALTAYATPLDRDTALVSGFNEYLTKPFEPATLVSTIRRLHDDRRIGSAA